MAPPARLIAGFLVRVIVLYGVLMAPWPGLSEGYAAFYRGCAGVFLSSFPGGGVVRFEPLSPPDGVRDTQIVCSKRGSQVVASMPTGSRYGGRAPTALLVALVLATPIPWSRRCLGLFFGLLLVNIYVGWRISLNLLDFYTAPHSLALYEIGPFFKPVLSATKEFVAGGITGAYFPPIFIWILVSLRRTDLIKVVRQQDVARDTN